jgi:mannan endo-1,4-beta-mannosidase
MNHKIIFVATVIQTALLPVTAKGQTIRPANPNASADTRTLLTYLYKLPRQSENRLISGHLAGGSVGPTAPKGQDGGYRFKMDEIKYLHEISGQWVGLIGADYCAGWIKCPDPVEATMYYEDVNKGLIAYWNAGGLVIITTHQFDPRQLYEGGGYHSYLDWPQKDRLDISKLYTPGLQEYDNFRVIMDRWAEGLAELQEHGVVVMWRPYNEATNSAKWWCRQPADHFKALYRHTFNYLTNEKKLNNLLWVYDAKPAGKNELNLSHYPGDEFVDIVGYTMNWDSGPAAQPAHPYPKKVFGCVEFNVRFDQKKFSYLDITRDYDYGPKFRWMRDKLPYASFFMSWDRLSGPYGCGTAESVRAMYNDPTVANRGEINWRSRESTSRPPILCRQLVSTVSPRQ